MTIEQINAFLQSPWAIVVLVLVIISGSWYFVKESIKVAKQPLTKKTPWALFKLYILGDPFTLIALAFVIICVIMAITHWQIAQIGK